MKTDQWFWLKKFLKTQHLTLPCSSPRKHWLIATPENSQLSKRTGNNELTPVLSGIPIKLQSTNHGNSILNSKYGTGHKLQKHHGKNQGYMFLVIKSIKQLLQLLLLYQGGLKIQCSVQISTAISRAWFIIL